LKRGVLYEHNKQNKHFGFERNQTSGIVGSDL